MTIATEIAHPTPVPASAMDARKSGAWLLGVGTAVPRLHWSQKQIEHALAEAWQLTGADRQRWARICRGAEIEHRYGIAPMRDLIDLTTAERMNRFEREAPPLASHAAQQAMAAARIAPSQVTDLIIVTCTGFSAPGLDVALVDALRLPAHVRRVQVGYMGCFGAVTGLRAAIGTCAADPNACALIVCCELCTLHIRRDPGIDNQIASALFGDGAAAAIVTGQTFVAQRSPSEDRRHSRACQDCSPRHPLGRVELGASRLLKEGRQWMRWRVTDHGFAMTLDRIVPTVLRRSLRPWVDTVTGGRQQHSMLVHPGGPGILDAAAAALKLPDRDPGLMASRAILRDFGNLSSGTVLFVLERAIAQGANPPWLILAFGPGLTMEGLPITAHAMDR